MTENVEPTTPAETPAPEAPVTEAVTPPAEAIPPAADSSEPPKTDDSAQTDSNDAEGAQDKTDADKNADPEDLLFEEEKPEEGDSDKDGESDKDGDKPEDKDDEEGEDGEKAPVVEVDKLEIPEDMPIPEAIKGEFDQFAKDMADDKLTPQEKMQKAVDLHVKSQQNAVSTWNDTKETWREEVRNDPELGGPKLEESKKSANRAIRAIWANPENGGSDEGLKEFQADLKMLGLGNKKSFIRGMVNLSKMIGEDSQDPNESPGGTGSELSVAEKLYGKDGQGRQ